MTPLTILRFLFGSRDAIERIAACRQAPWIGLLLVFSAALAREYDGQDLLHEPWHLFLPLAASLGTSFVLYVLLRVVGSIRGAGWERGWSGYWSFLGLYWMTAPLAWLYAIPVERFLDEALATFMNLAVLGLVSMWRVLLIVRVSEVLFSASPISTAFPVLLMAATAAVVGISIAPKPIYIYMAGISYSESEELIQIASILARFLAVVVWPIGFIGTCAVAIQRRPSWRWVVAHLEPRRTARTAWLFGASAVLVWLPILFVTQPEQMRRREVERMIRSGRVADALRFMSDREPSDFPPFWDPPPRIAYGETGFMIDIAETLLTMDVKPWVRHEYDVKFHNFLNGPEMFEGVWRKLSLSELQRVANVLERRQRPTWIGRSQFGLIDLLETNSTIPPELEGRYRRLLDDRAKELEQLNLH